MKKLVYGVLFLALVGITVIGCQKESNNPSSNVSNNDSQKFFNENISFFDARVRSLNENQYVKEIYLKNFSDKDWGEENIGFQGFIFEDDGTGNDLIANDGIFTSIQKYVFNEKVVYDNKKAIKSVMENSVISPAFIHYAELQLFSKQYQLKANNSDKVGGTATITCDVKIHSTGCIADDIWSGFGCIEFSNCSVTIGW